MKDSRPDYTRIFKDMIAQKFPERTKEFQNYLKKENLSIMEVIDFNDKIFGLKDKKTLIFDQKHKTYDQETILQILSYQKREQLNNVQLANHFNLSRNTVTRWKKQYVNILD